MDTQLVLYNVCYFNGKTNIDDAIIYIQNGIIKDIYRSDNFNLENTINSGIKCLDCKNGYVLPSWIDSHLHFPGMVLFETFGVNLFNESNVKGYLSKIEGGVQYKQNFIRGYGWNASVCNGEENSYKALKTSIDKFINIPAILFSDDYHNCICNNTLISLIKNKNLNVEIGEDGRLFEKDVFRLLSSLEEVSFGDKMIEIAILEFQKMLISKGVTAVQSLMFLGGNGQKEWEILKKLDQEGKIFIDVSIAANLYSDEIIENMFEKFNRLKQYSSKHIKINTVKIYVDGVVDNKTAYLKEPYEGEEDCGKFFWDMALLKEVCQLFDFQGIQIHMHAIGDAAVRDAVIGLTYAMDINKSKMKNRHVITHLQLSDYEDIQKMGKYGIIASVQPYWFPQEDKIYPLDIKNLGDRALHEYRMGTLFANNVIVTSSSDCPVTKNPNPLNAIKIAINRKNEKERVSVEEMINSFTINGAFQLNSENVLGQIKKGFRGNIIVISENILDKPIESAELLYTIIGGEVKYCTKKEKV